MTDDVSAAFRREIQDSFRAAYCGDSALPVPADSEHPVGCIDDADFDGLMGMARGLGATTADELAELVNGVIETMADLPGLRAKSAHKLVGTRSQPLLVIVTS